MILTEKELIEIKAGNHKKWCCVKKPIIWKLPNYEKIIEKMNKWR